MSGIAGIYNLDGAPVDRALLKRMTDAIAHRGPDGIHHWVDGPVGMGHCMLQTTPESLYETQPLTDESGNLCLTMDGRVDNRAELKAAIEAKGARLRDDTDAELVLKAYECWGEDCPVRILGDFAFVIWDKRQRQLFCARDHMGIKPLYYATARNSVLFANSIACLRTNPNVTTKLNERAVGDFLLFDCNMDLSTTTFADIQRLPPGHYLICSGQKQLVRGYWSLPVEDEIHYVRWRDYVDQFNTLMRRAVSDRLRTRRVAVLMSGGLDSSSIAATACRIMPGLPENGLHAFTYVHDRLMRDQERHYSGLVAQTLRIPIHFLPQDDYRLFERAEHLHTRAPDPLNEPFQAVTADQLRSVAENARVALTGDGGDPIFYRKGTFFLDMLRSLRIGELARASMYFWVHRKRPPRLGLRTILRTALGRRRSLLPEYPTWFNTSFEKRYDLRSRWREKSQDRSRLHPRRPESYESLTNPLWQQLFAAFSTDLNRSPVEVRHPFFDVRLLRYMLRVPSFPWCSEKLMLRVVMQGMLPEQVRMRSKATIVADPILVRSKEQCQLPRGIDLGKDQVFEYVDEPKANEAFTSSPHQIWVNVRPISLCYWLSGVAATN